MGSVREAILDSAELGLSGAGAGVIVTGKFLSWDLQCDGAGGDPIFTAAVAGAAGGVTAVGASLAGPVVGAHELIQSMRHVKPAELAEREGVLANALRQMAAQQPFRDALLRTAGEKMGKESLMLQTGISAETPLKHPLGARLEARVEELRLERTGSSEGSYLLRISTRARLIRQTDGAVCFEQSAEYRSGTSLFLDWTFQGAVEGVAETGYRALAQ